MSIIQKQPGPVNLFVRNGKRVTGSSQEEHEKTKTSEDKDEIRIPYKNEASQANQARLHLLQSCRHQIHALLVDAVCRQIAAEKLALAQVQTQPRFAQLGNGEHAEQTRKKRESDKTHLRGWPPVLRAVYPLASPSNRASSRGLHACARGRGRSKCTRVARKRGLPASSTEAGHKQKRGTTFRLAKSELNMPPPSNFSTP